MARRKNWSKMIEAHGVKVRIYERAGSNMIHREVRLPDGSKDRRSLKTSDRKRAEDMAKELAQEFARLQLTGGASAVLTVGDLRALYEHHRAPLLSMKRRQFMTLAMGLVESHLGASFEVTDFSQHWADSYLAARQSGELQPDDRRATAFPAAGTIRNELQAFSTACNWAANFRVKGRPLLGFNPVRGVKLPEEKNPARPLVTEARYRALLVKADEADGKGRLRALLVLAWETGRRINAILHLRASDVLRTEDQVRAALQEAGRDEAAAEHWPFAVRWRAEHDKMGYEDVSPLSGAAREALEAYLRTNPKLGEAWIFPATEDDGKALSKLMAGYYLIRAEKLAGVAHMKRGGWHAFRRAWATRRKHLPVKDVMAAGGWRDVKALQSAYQAADPETVRKVMEIG